MRCLDVFDFGDYYIDAYDCVEGLDKGKSLSLDSIVGRVNDKNVASLVMGVYYGYLYSSFSKFYVNDKFCGLIGDALYGAGCYKDSVVADAVLRKDALRCLDVLDIRDYYSEAYNCVEELDKSKSISYDSIINKMADKNISALTHSVKYGFMYSSFAYYYHNSNFCNNILEAAYKKDCLAKIK